MCHSCCLHTMHILLNLLNDEQYHIDTIRESFLDTYDFLCSLRDTLAYMGDY